MRKDTETVQKKWKIPLYGLNRNLDDEGEKISELEDVEIRTMLPEAQREKKAGGEIKRASVICWMISSILPYM